MTLELTRDEFRLLCFVMGNEARRLRDAGDAHELEMLRQLADRIMEQYPDVQLILPPPRPNPSVPVGEYDASCVACGEWIGIGLACEDCDSGDDDDERDDLTFHSVEEYEEWEREWHPDE